MQAVIVRLLEFSITKSGTCILIFIFLQYVCSTSRLFLASVILWQKPFFSKGVCAQREEE